MVNMNDTLWCLLVPKSGGGFAKIPAHSEEHAEGMAVRWKGDVQVAEWTGDPALHAAMLRGMDKLFRDE